MRKMRKWAALWVAAALVLGGCSSGAGGGDTKADVTPAATETVSGAESKEANPKEADGDKAADTSAAESGSAQAGETGAAVKANGKYKITLVVKNLTNPMWIAVQEGAEKAAAEAGVDLTVLAPATADSNEEQISLIEQSIAKGPDALVVIPADSVGIVPAVEAANSAGIPLIDVNTKIDTSGGCRIETFIAVENYTAAVSVAEKLVEMLDQKGDVIILEGKAGAQSSVDIVAGANDTFAKYPDINVVASQTASWNRTEAYNVTLNLLEANPGVAAIFAANDEMAMGALEAVSQAGKSGQILITGLDANEDAKAAVDAGTLAITCDKNGIGQGYEGVMKAVMLLNGETLEPNYVVDTYLYTKD